MNIAVLEDNPAIGGYMTTALQLAGHHVEVFRQAVSLLEALFTEGAMRTPLPYEVLTVDLLLPGGVSGLEVITLIRRLISPQDLHIIVISGAGDALLEQVKQAFPDIALLIKPFKMHRLLELFEARQRSQEKSAPRSSEMVINHEGSVLRIMSSVRMVMITVVAQATKL